MDYRAVVFILTIIFCILDGFHFLVGLGTISSTSPDRNNYYSTWAVNLESTTFALFATIIGTITIYKNYYDNCNIEKKRAYDVYNVIAGLIIFFSLIISGNTTSNTQAHMYFNFTATLYTLKFVFSSILLSRIIYINRTTPLLPTTTAEY